MENTFARSTATIAAWNLAGYGGISDERVARQVEGLILLDAEVIALVEINPIDTLAKLCAGLAAAGLEYDCVVIPQNSNLHIGVLHKRGTTVTNAFLLDGSDLGDPARRRALVADVTVGRFDFKMIAVHLKSGRGRAEQLIRDDQCRVIGDFITGLRAASREDILLVGDYNMIPGQDISNFHLLGGDDLMDFLSSWDLQDRFSHILQAGRANLLDGFAISRTYSTEYVRGSLRLFPMHWSMDIGRERFRSTVSDHLPFAATFRIDRSRD